MGIRPWEVKYSFTRLKGFDPKKGSLLSLADIGDGCELHTTGLDRIAPLSSWAYLPHRTKTGLVLSSISLVIS